MTIKLHNDDFKSLVEDVKANNYGIAKIKDADAQSGMVITIAGCRFGAASTVTVPKREETFTQSSALKYIEQLTNAAEVDRRNLRIPGEDWSVYQKIGEEGNLESMVKSLDQIASDIHQIFLMVQSVVKKNNTLNQLRFGSISTDSRNGRANEEES